MGAGTCETHALVRREPVEREARVTFHRSREELAAQHVELQEVVWRSGVFVPQARYSKRGWFPVWQKLSGNVFRPEVNVRPIV